MKIGSTNDSWASRVEAQPMFDILQAANRKEKESGYVARMEIGDTPGFLNLKVHELLAKHSADEFRYSPSKGNADFIDTIFATQWPKYSNIEYDVSVAPANFLITASLAAVMSPGDTILIPNPGFPTYRLAANFLRLKIKYYDPRDFSSESLAYNKKKIESYLKNTKVIIVNNPSNPLGFAIEGGNFSNVIAKFPNLKVISDETYANLVYDDTNPDIEGLDFIRLRSFSKEHCAPGLRIGYALARTKISKSISDFTSLSISCAPSFIQAALNEYLKSKESFEFVSNLRSTMKNRILELKSAIPNSNLATLPNSAFYAFLSVKDDEAAFNHLLENNIATCPGSRFGSNGRGFIRVSLAGPEKNFSTDISKLGKLIGDSEIS
jgi:aspartate/methionine/tyrosine aminotransferase